MTQKSPKQLAISTGANVPDQIRMESLQKIIYADDNLTNYQKRQLLKQFFRMRFEQRKEQFRVALMVDKYRLESQAAIVERQIAAEKDGILLSIREDYIKMMEDIGLRVEMSQLEFLVEFGVKLNEFRGRLAKRELDPKEKETILQLSFEAFNRICDRFGELTANMLLSATAVKE